MHYALQVNRHSKLPLYQQLYEILRGMIVRGDYKPGDMLPAEPELCLRYQVSRTTVRQVLDKLVGEGLITRQRGRGTFVAQPTLEKTLSRIVSFTQDMRERGMVPHTKVLSSGLVAATEDIAERLQVAPGETLARLERLRLADDEPMAVEEAFLVHRYVPGILQKDFSAVPLRETLENTYGIHLVRASQKIHAIAANSYLAKWLGVKRNSPLLYIERVTYSQYESPVEFLRVYYRADRYSLYNELQG